MRGFLFLVISSLLIVFSTTAFASNIRTGNFYPKNDEKCGWHLELDGNLIVLEAVYSRTQQCGDYVVLTGQCNYKTNVCLLENGEKIIFLSDGNLIFRANDGTNYKNYPNIR